MAMPSGNVVISDKMQFPNSGGAGGGEIHRTRQWYPDERDGFISWIRAEFAAANAIIDSLCHHMRTVGDPGEYDLVIGCIQQRRAGWNPVLHMQQYFPISEIMFALQQAAWRRQQRFADQGKVGVKEFKRSGFGSRMVQRVEMAEESHGWMNGSAGGNAERRGVGRDIRDGKLGNEVIRSDDKVTPNPKYAADASSKPQVDSAMKSLDGSSQTCVKSNAVGVKDEETALSKGNSDLVVEKNAISIQNQGSENLAASPKTFSSLEIYDGKTVNLVEGLNLYDKLLDEVEVSNLLSLVNDLRAAGKRGELLGPTFVVSKRPYRGHGREIIQLGAVISDAPLSDGDNEKKVEPIPGVIQGVIDRLVSMQVMLLKPDACIIDIFNEGDHSQPHSWPHWYGKPICMLSLSECDVVFGRAMGIDRPGDYSGSLRLTLSPGSVLTMQGKSAEVAKRAIPSIRKQRILVTLTKSQPMRSSSLQGFHHGHGQSPSQSSNWGQHMNHRPPNYIRPKHYTPVPTTGVLPIPPMRSQVPVPPSPPSSMAQLFVAPSVPAAVAFAPHMSLAPPGSGSWATPSPRHTPPRLIPPGTGVFLPPPGSTDNASPPPPEISSSSTGNEVGGGLASGTSPTTGIENDDAGKVNRIIEGKLHVDPKQQVCNGNGSGDVETKEDQEVVDTSAGGSEPAATD